MAFLLLIGDQRLQTEIGIQIWYHLHLRQQSQQIAIAAQ